MKNIIMLLSTLMLSGCAQIQNTYYVQGDNNRITATDAVNKTTDDLMDVSGSAYGDASTNEGRQ